MSDIFPTILYAVRDKLSGKFFAADNLQDLPKSFEPVQVGVYRMEESGTLRREIVLEISYSSKDDVVK